MSVVLALLAAVANATASVLQRKAAGRVPDAKALRPALIWQLLHYPVWFAGVGAVFAGFLLQAVALSAGGLALVQPLFVAELPLALILSMVVFGSRLGRREWGAIAAMSAGLALALGTAEPSAGAAHLSPARWVIGLGGSAALIAALFLVGRRHDGAARATYLGVAAGASFGLTAALMKAMTAAFEHGAASGFTAWQLYLMLAAGALAMFLLQSSLQAGRLEASQPGLTITNPVVASVWGIVLFGETIRGGPFVLAEVVGALSVVAGIIVLVRSPLLSAESGRHEQGDEQARDAAATPE